MALDSQSQRRGMGGGYGASRRRRGWGLQILGVVAVLGAVMWVSWTWIRGGRHTGEVTPALVTGGDPAPITPRQAFVDSTIPKPPPVSPSPAPTTPASPATLDKPLAPPALIAPSTSDLARALEQSRSLAAAGKLVEARKSLNAALAASPPAAEAQAAREQLATLNQSLIFSPKSETGDPCTETYVVQSGDALAKIAQTHHVPWEFVAQINGDIDPSRLRVSQRLKLIKGPFHAVVHKKDFRLDVYLGNHGTPEAVYVRSFRIGLGEHGSTPAGNFVVRNRLVDPPWTNPRTGERFNAKDPKNPLGGRWLGLRGADAETGNLKGYGIHGTIAPESIGTEASMGCVRLLPEDIKLLYSMLEPEQSRVTITD